VQSVAAKAGWLSNSRRTENTPHARMQMISQERIKDYCMVAEFIV
jgi:hypothetical protein